MTSRLKQSVLNIGKRAGTKILEHGLGLASFGLSLFSMNAAKPEQPADEEPEEKDEAKKEDSD